MIRARLTMLEPHLAPTIKMTNSSGIDRTTSTIRIMTPSTTPPSKPGDGSPQRSHQRGDRGREQADLQRGLTADHELAKHVESGDFGAERMALHGRGVGVEHVGDADVAVVEQRPQVAEQHEKHEDAKTGDGEPVLSERAQAEPPAALDDGDLTALGDSGRSGDGG